MARKAVWWGSRFGGEIGFAGKPVSRGNSFFVTLAKIFVIILVAKQLIYNEKLMTLPFCDFLKKLSRWQ